VKGSDEDGSVFIIFYVSVFVAEDASHIVGEYTDVAILELLGNC
jgi:hypothetical protein